MCKKYINVNCDIVRKVGSVPFLGRSLAGFIVTKNYPDTVMSTNMKRTVATGKRGSAGVCSLLAIGITRGDAHALHGAVELLVDAAGQPDQGMFWESRVAKAQDAARGILARRGAGRNTEMLSYIAAHCAAGYGPISMLLDDPDIEKIEVRSRQSRICVTHRILGDCVTNMSFSSKESFMGAVGNLEGDSQRNGGLYAVDISAGADGPALRVSRARHDSGACSYVHDGLASPEAAAYLWIAVEAGMNIIWTGSRHGIRIGLRAMVSLIPSYYKVAVEADGAPGWAPGNPNIMCAPNAVSCSREAYPDMIVKERLDRGATSLFKAAMLGRPFLAGVPGVEQGSLPDILQKQPYSVGPELLSELDILVGASASGKLEDITEYRWFERGEAEMKECAAASAPKCVRMAQGGALDVKALSGSKAVYEYAKAFVLTREQAIAELQKRASFLGAKSTARVCDYRALQKLK
jgi:hypothetical protein